MAYDKTVVVPLPPDETFALITQPERLRRWNNIAARVDLRTGGSYRWNIVPGNYTVGYIREVEPGRRLVLGWGPELPAADQADPSTVTIILEPVADGTSVRLIHDGLPEDQQAGHEQGWNHYLARLVTAAAEGDAGQDNWLDDIDAIGDLDEQRAAEASLAVAQRVLFHVDPADLTHDTPCSEFTVAQVVEHLAGSITGIAGAAGAQLSIALTDTPERDIADLAQPALEAWAERGLSGTLDVGAGDMPAAHVLGILAVELLVHAWDVASATGQTLEIDEKLASYVLGLCQRVVVEEVRAKVGFNPAIDTPEDAPAMEKLIAFTGRSGTPRR